MVYERRGQLPIVRLREGAVAKPDSYPCSEAKDSGKDVALLEESEIDGIGHGLIAKIVGMEMIFRSEARQ